MGDAALAWPPGVADRLERGKRRRFARIGFAGISKRGNSSGGPKPAPSMASGANRRSRIRSSHGRPVAASSMAAATM
jgi:hypothetical protein